MHIPAYNIKLKPTLTTKMMTNDTVYRDSPNFSLANCYIFAIRA